MPKMEDFKNEDLLKLALVPKVSSTRLRNLINYFKTPSAVLNAKLQELRNSEQYSGGKQ
jgi:ERCC4-type nuclease